LSFRGARCYLFPMSTLAEIEKSVSQFSAEELAALEQIIRKARRAKEQVQKSSLRDANPVSVGKILKPIGTRDEWYSEMLEGRV
jgi:Cu2+-containing amine oxidase